MSDVTVRSHWDRVFIVAGSAEIMMPYAAAFSVVQGVRLAAKQAMLMVGEDVSKWHGYSELREIVPTPVVSGQVKKTLGGKFEWEVRVKDWDERVFLQFGNYELVLHFEKALKLATELRQTAREAKAWAGDRNTGIRAMGTLTDAEKNYKNGWM